jgi:phage-related protein
MRFVPIKTEEQLDLQALHRVRERWVMRRTAVVNQIRSLLLERGLTPPKGRSHLDAQLPRILEDAELNLSDSFRALLAQLKLELEQFAARIEEMDRVIQKTASENEACQRLTEIPGVGPGVFELRDQDERAWYRVVYLSRIEDVIYVLHCFEKKSREMPRRDFEKAKQRLKAVKARLAEEKKREKRS